MKKASQNDVAQIFAFPLIEGQSIKVEKEKLTIIRIILNLSDDKNNQMKKEDYAKRRNVKNKSKKDLNNKKEFKNKKEGKNR